MRAILYHRYGDPSVLQGEMVPDPVPGEGEILVDVHAASVIPGDWKLRAGQLQHIFKIDLPKIPGRDGAGIVRAVGTSVEEYRPGQKVCFVRQHTEPGSYAEMVNCAPEAVVPMPKGLGFVEAAALMHAGVCAWIAVVETGKLRRGERFLVHGGAGAIGGMAVQIARHIGAEVIATCRATNRDYVESLGADRTIPYDEVEFSEAVSDIDIVLDLIGGEVHARSYDVIKPGGRMVWLIAKPFEDRSGDYDVSVIQAKIHDEPAVLRKVVELASSGVLTPQVADSLPLAEAAEAHRRLEAGTVSRGRLVLLVRDEEMSSRRATEVA